MATEGSLVMIPSLLGSCVGTESLSPEIKCYIDKIDHYIVEREKSARRFIKIVSPEKSQSSLCIMVFDKHRPEEGLMEFVKLCEQGFTVGVLSEVGCPGVADPGALLVRLAHKCGIPVFPLVGPSSVLMALMASGMNGQRFAFQGYLPIDVKDRSQAIRRLENTAVSQGQTQIFIETPYRNQSLYEDLLRVLKPGTQLCIATNITLPGQSIITKYVSEWQAIEPDIHKKPTVFLLGNRSF